MSETSKIAQKAWLPQGGELVEDWEFRKYLDSTKSLFPGEFSVYNYESADVEDISGNINRVKRVKIKDTVNNTALIIKHVPKDGTLARFPTIQFSPSRLEYDRMWLKFASDALKENTRLRVPKIYHFDPELRCLVMQDLGLDSLAQALNKNYFNHDELVKSVADIGEGLAGIHFRQTIAETMDEYGANRTSSDNSKITFMPNPAARENRPYIFSLHLDRPDLVAELWRNSNHAIISLDERLSYQFRFIETYAERIKPVMNQLVSKLDEKEGAVFVHGDLHTGSLILGESNPLAIGIIDAELADFGPAGLDLGLLLAHLIAGIDFNFNKVPEIAESFIGSYVRRSASFENTKSPTLEDVCLYTGAEILRRLMGPAGFNSPIEKEKFEFLLEFSCKLILEPTKSSRNLFPELTREQNG